MPARTEDELYSNFTTSNQAMNGVSEPQTDANNRSSASFKSLTSRSDNYSIEELCVRWQNSLETIEQSIFSEYAVFEKPKLP